jgi:hypothetical protein
MHSQCVNSGQCGENNRKRRLENPNVPEDGPIRSKHVVKGNVWYICATNRVDGNCNKALTYTQYEAEVQHFH